MSDDYLGKLSKKVEEVVGSESPFDKAKESSKVVRIRDSQFKQIRQIAFNEDKKFVDILDDLIAYALKNDSRYND